MASAPIVPAPHMSVLPLRIEALAKRFGKLAAVDGVSLELRSGECLGLLGPNGVQLYSEHFEYCCRINIKSKRIIPAADSN